MSRTDSGLYPGHGSSALFQKPSSTDKFQSLGQKSAFLSLLLIVARGFGAACLGLESLQQLSVHVLMLGS